VTTSRFDSDIAAGERFEFGKNWQAFLSVLDDERIDIAEQSLKDMLGAESIQGKTFLDVGSGSGLFSLAAIRLGAEFVHSFDYDPQSIACTQELKRRYFPNSSHWSIEQASVLDKDYLRKLGQWDVVYSWGVLHHTGNMWSALEAVASLVQKEGQLFISIYNDQGAPSLLWTRVKALYNKSLLLKWLIICVFIPYFIMRGLVSQAIRGNNPIARYSGYKKRRGMSLVHDWLDWLGGYPFEVAKPEAIVGFFHERHFQLRRLLTCGGRHGCNEFVFRKT
jgi:2-polyprenyl-3-methyl-5-hydroxy-6-metoxy-1,4-benzoquinol methylase